MPKNYLSACLLVWMFILAQHSIQAKSLNEFLNEFAIEVEASHISDQIINYLDPSLKKQEISWYKGSILSTEQELFDELALKFNTFSNSLYLKHRGKIYSISNSGIAEFVLEEEEEGEGESRQFVKGFGKFHQYRLTASFEGQALMIITYVSQYPEMSDFRLREFRTYEGEYGEGELLLEIDAAEHKSVVKLQNYLKELAVLQHVNLLSERSPFSKDTFYERLIEIKGVSFLKLNHKRISSYDSNALARHSNAISFDDSSYYLSNGKGEIQQVRFQKKSIISALSFAGIDPKANKVPHIRNEKHMKEWLGEIK